MYKITDLKARYIYDSRGIPTVEAEILLNNNAFANFSVASGASKGSREALELRDNKKDFNGQGVSKAISNILTIIKPQIIDKVFNTQEELDLALIKLDGTKNKSNLGANAILAVSGAFFKASYKFFETTEVSLPLPLINVINGGKHANNELDIQEFMISPIGASSFSQGLQWSCEIFHTLKDILRKKGFSTAVGDEGGFAPALRTDEEALELLSLAVEKAGFKIGKEIGLALDVAAGELYNITTQTYCLNNKNLTSDLLLEHYKKLVSNFNIFSIEDPFFEDDYHAFAKITQELGKTVQIVGDDLFVTQCQYIEHGIQNNLANALLVKMNQVGTISETFEAINLARRAGWKIIVSHRSGETEETFLADLAVLSKADQIKAGSMSRSERLAKYNRLLRIEEFKGLKNG